MSVAPLPVSSPTRVLLLEDADADARAVESVLCQFSFVVSRARRFSDALTALRSSQFDVVLADLGLPDSTGLDTLEGLRQQAIGLPIVVMTGHDDESTAVRAVAAGAQDYLIKGSTGANTLTRSLRYAVERGRAQAAISISEAHLRNILEGALDAVVSMYHDGRIIQWNRSAEEIFGWPRAEVLGRPLVDLIIPERFRDAHQRGVQMFMETGEAPFLGKRVEWTSLRKDGSEFPAEVRISAEAEAGGITFTAFVSDITERRRAEEELDELRRRYELILNSITDGVHGVDLAGNIIFENPAAAAMLGWPPGALIGRSAYQTIQPLRVDGSARPEAECLWHWTLAGGGVRFSDDDVFWRRDGKEIRVAFTTAPMLDDHGRIAGAVVTFRDVSKQKEMEQQIEQAARVESLGRVSASVAHEFNNLLMGLKPFADLLSRKAEEDRGLSKPVGHILNVVRRGQRLTDEILRFTNPAEPRMLRVDLAALLREFADEARGILAERRMEMELPEALVVRADVDQLSQVMLNLVTNARDATKTDDVVTIGAARASSIAFLQEQLPEPEGYAALYVRDTGYGIDAEAKARLFEPFFTTRKRGGTGLGLAIAWRIASAHGGQILVDSEAGRGSAFYVVLPLS